MLLTSALDNTPAFVVPKAFSHRETPTLVDEVYNCGRQLSLLVWRCEVMGFEFSKVRYLLHHTRVNRRLTVLASCKWFDKPKVLLWVFHASPAWSLPPPSSISCNNVLLKASTKPFYRCMIHWRLMFSKLKFLIEASHQLIKEWLPMLVMRYRGTPYW